jgi:hypothetical protein
LNGNAKPVFNSVSTAVSSASDTYQSLEQRRKGKEVEDAVGDSKNPVSKMTKPAFILKGG